MKVKAENNSNQQSQRHFLILRNVHIVSRTEDLYSQLLSRRWSNGK